MALCLALPANAAPGVSAAHSVLMDADSGTVLFAKQAQTESLIASTTKIMTGLLVCEQCNLNDRLRVPAEAVGVEGSSMYLKAEEVLAVRDLLYGLMLQSGNDAAVALAIYCGGTVEGFVEQMNRKAERLSLQHTHFANPNGLDDEQNYSSAQDLATLTAYALHNPDFAQVVGTKTVTIGSRQLTNHNKLLWQYPGAIGVKTGYTRAAGRILVSAAQRDGRTLVAVTINAPSDWQDHKALLDFGFAQYETKTLVQPGQQLCTAAVAADTDQEVPLVAKEAFSYPVLPGEEITFAYEGRGMIYPPLLSGDDAGTVQIMCGDHAIGQVAVTWGESIFS